MPDIKEARRRFTAALIALGVIAIASIGILVSPIGRGSRQAPQQIAQLKTEVKAKNKEIAPLSGIDGKVIEAGKQIEEFYDARLPESYASISEELTKVATASGVQLTTGRYQNKPADVDGLDRIRIDAVITGNYLQAVKFINSMERDEMFFVIDGVNLGEPQNTGAIRLQIRMETYLKT